MAVKLREIFWLDEDGVDVAGKSTSAPIALTTADVHFSATTTRTTIGIASLPYEDVDEGQDLAADPGESHHFQALTETNQDWVPLYVSHVFFRL